SAMKDERVLASTLLAGPARKGGSGGVATLALDGADKKGFLEDLRQALFASKIVSYAQGYMLMREAAKEMGWKLNYGGIALMWRGGCIIRSAFLGKIKEAFEKQPELQNLLLDGYFRGVMERCQGSWRRVIARAVEAGIPVPALSTALSFYDGYRCERLPANLLQAQRDYFGAHSYERLDKEQGKFFHTNWTGSGGKVSAGTYEV
ncbi:MAG TPA: phosphogluconate dehydrogenase (NADP(+)-dependent, decarboxylating), partial [Spirochaetaceae bacterium]|nr:phosphogluconate dehydrogenase (NADP(+)-dependent, decarboxylating) [Spirochaetaceae bacterium]